MSVKELRDYLNSLDESYDNYKICVPTNDKKTTIGGLSPKANIISINPGFDWNSGIMFLKTQEDIWTD